MKNLKEISENDLRAYAKERALTVTVRTYDHGNSNDTERPATPEESRIIETIIYGALLALRSGRDVDGVVNGAEYIALVQLDIDPYRGTESHINTYDSVYCPIKDYIA